jgi:hypothetical protein
MLLFFSAYRDRMWEVNGFVQVGYTIDAYDKSVTLSREDR